MNETTIDILDEEALRGILSNVWDTLDGLSDIKSDDALRMAAGAYVLAAVVDALKQDEDIFALAVATGTGEYTDAFKQYVLELATAIARGISRSAVRALLTDLGIQL